MKKVIMFGGGTGLTYLLESLKDLEVDLTVVVTTSDNGGSTGKIRNYYDIPAVGDLRRAIIALSNDENIEELMNYRFDENIEYHTIGNLIITALTNIEQDFEIAVDKYCQMLNVTKKIYPISNKSVHISALMEDGQVIEGEREIVKYNSKIKKIFYKNHELASKKIIDTLIEADFIVLSTGSLFTSIISNLVFDNMLDILPKLKAKIIYINNIMTEKGETDNFKVSDHINAINQYFEEDIIDYVLVNNNDIEIDQKIINDYIEEEAKIVNLDLQNINQDKIKIIVNKYLKISSDGHIRHDSKKIKNDLIKIFKGNYE